MNNLIGKVIVDYKITDDHVITFFCNNADYSYKVESDHFFSEISIHTTNTGPLYVEEITINEDTDEIAICGNDNKSMFLVAILDTTDNHNYQVCDKTMRLVFVGKDLE